MILKVGSSKLSVLFVVKSVLFLVPDTRHLFGTMLAYRHPVFDTRDYAKPFAGVGTEKNTGSVDEEAYATSFGLELEVFSIKANCSLPPNGHSQLTLSS
jgi:hypothetical protein